MYKYTLVCIISTHEYLLCQFERISETISFYFTSYIFMTKSQILTGPFNITFQLLSFLNTTKHAR